MFYIAILILIIIGLKVSVWITRAVEKRYPE